MKILMICFVYNEIKYLPHTVKYYQDNGCEVYIIDNYSTDGTWEWLKANRIASHQVSTNESFDLRILQREILRTLPKLKPDWVIYGGADLYYIAWIPLNEYIKKVEEMGFNQLSMMCWSAFNTGEESGTPLPTHFHYAAPWREVVMISKYNASYSMAGDNVTIDKSKCYTARHAMAINYGACKPREEQEVKLARRKVAWANGMRSQQGVHFLRGQKRGWIRSKKGLRDLRKIPECKLIQKTSAGSEKDSYDKLYSESVMYRKHYRDMVYLPAWNHIAGKIPPGSRILDLGCGPGHMANILYDRGFRDYTGIDFSHVAIDMAKRRVPAFTFLENDLFDMDYRQYKDHQLISTETFEHLVSDTDLIRRLPKSRIVFSVPDFMCANHYRTYNSEEQIRSYYRGILEISEVKPFHIGSNRVIYVVDARII